MPDVEPLRFPSREGRRSQPDPADLQAVCTGRRRTCALLNSPLPCVNKAVSHIQELKMIVEDWCQQSGKYQPRTDQDRHQFHKTLRFQSRDSDAESVMSTELFVEGIAINSRESCALTPLLKKVNDVLGEVMYLIERLEADRQSAEEALHKEKKRKEFLESQVDSISLWKRQEHSSVVQKEHEACVRDVAELKWQLKVAREKLDRAQEKLVHSEVPNQRLHDDISFTKNQIPIVNENLEHQRGLTDRIRAAQSEADELYSKTQNDLVRVQNELKRMEQDTNDEKASLEQEVLMMKKKLSNKLEDLHRLEMIEKGLCAEIKDAEKTIALTEEKCAGITIQILEMTELEKTEKDRISQLKIQVEEEIKPNRKLKEKIIALQEDIEKNRLNGEAEVSGAEEQLGSKRAALAGLREENRQCELNLEEYGVKLSQSEAAVKQMREEMKHVLQKIIDNDERGDKAKQEMTRVVAQHRVALTKLREQERLTFMQEEGARAEIEKLRRDLTSHTTALELLKRQCADVNEELDRQQRSSKIINLKLQKEFEEASTATKALETKVKKVKKLTETLERTQREHGRTLISLEKEKKLKRDHLKATQDLHSATVKRRDDIACVISDLAGRCEDCREASAEMEQTVESMQDSVAELQSLFDVAQFKHKSAAVVMSTLQSDINNCQRRAQRSVQIHTAHVTARKKLMEDAKDALRAALEENKQLASQYEELRKTLVEARQEAASALSRKNQAHKSFHYYTQLSLLQKRMHKALVEYFKQRSLYSRAELDRCQALSQETDQKIRGTQARLSEEIRLISAFLRSLTDDSTSGEPMPR